MHIGCLPPYIHYAPTGCRSTGCPKECPKGCQWTGSPRHHKGFNGQGPMLVYQWRACKVRALAANFFVGLGGWLLVSKSGAFCHLEWDSRKFGAHLTSETAWGLQQ
eukprot:scaffold36770_cov19-Tisochrysis_lutea.AAC.2